MSQYSQEILKVVVAKICQTIGWHSIQTTPLEIMVDILRRYLSEITKHTQSYATLFGHTQPNLDELGLAFRDLHINIADLEEYVRYVDSSPPIDSPLFPIAKESHLNFLKPGSGEVVTRPVHVNEHLPPMYKITEEAEVSQVKLEEPQNPEVFKRPADLSPNEPSIKRPRLVMEEEGRPTREISSVMMTTSGFLSPAREGKLPEARTPLSAMVVETPVTVPTPPPVPEPRKPPKIIKKPEKRKDKTSKELFKPDDLTFPLPQQTKKPPITKDIRTKPTKPGGTPSAPKKSPGKIIKKQPAVNPGAQVQQKPPAPDKIMCEPDKSKLNIFKKLSSSSKVKEPEKPEKHKIKDEESNSPDLIIDENNWEKKMEIAAGPEIIKNNPLLLQDKDFMYDDDLSPPGTPSTPKTPEMPQHSPPHKVEKPDKPPEPSYKPTEKPEKPDKPEKKKRKPPKIKTKAPKIPRTISPLRRKDDFKPDFNSFKSEFKPDFEPDLDRPKTPNDPINMIIKETEVASMLQQKSPVFMFPGLLPSGPGLIPSPMNNPLFPRLALPGKHGFGQPAHINPVMPLVPSFLPVSPTPQPKPQIPVETEKMPVPEAPPQPQPKKHLEVVTSTKEKHKKDKKDKPKKKNKKDKIKNKSEKRKLKEEKKEKDKIKKKDKKKDKEREQHEGSVPKLTLKIGSPRPPTPDVQIPRKIMIKPVVKKDEDQVVAPSTNQEKREREPSPELARISALITRPPKMKSSTKPINEHHLQSQSHSQSANDQTMIPTFHAKLKKNMFRTSSVPKIKNRERGDRDRNKRDSTDDINDLYMSSPPPLSTQTPPTPRVLDQSPQKDAAISAGSGLSVPGPGPPQVAPPTPTAFYLDNDGNKVWICPACGGQDDGSPMIGCDDCDAWYHWVCVGIQVPPDDNEDWYCRICIVKKQETLQMDKKKKRKKKERKEH